MTKYVALLRGINVGGKNSIRMVELKRSFEELGFTDVKTYINSGNVIFSTSRRSDTTLVTDIERSIVDTFGLDIPVVVRSRAEIEKVVQAIPDEWRNDQTQRTDVLFLWPEFDSPKVREQLAVNPDVDELLYIPDAVVWHFDRANYAKSKMHNFIGTAVYKKMTARNVNTVRKLHQLLHN